MKKSMKWLSFALALIMVLGVFASCGPSDEPGPSVTDPTTDPSATDPTETDPGSDTPIDDPSDASIIIGTNQIPTSLTPLTTTASILYAYQIPMYERLMYLNSDREYVPWILKSYEADPDGVTYDFEIHDNVYDSEGNHITANDIVFVMEKNIEKNMKPNFTKVKSVEATGDYSVHVVLSEDMVYLFEALMWDTDVFSQAAFEASGDEMSSKAVTTSQYEVTEYVADSTITYERRDDYWQTDRSLIPVGMEANTKKITFLVIIEIPQRMIALETGVVDMVYGIDGATANAYMDDDNFVSEIQEDKEGRTLFFSGHESSPVANDLNLRLAICYALDSEGFLQGAAHGYGKVMHDVAVSSGMGSNPRWQTEEYFTYNPEKAREYLEKSNYNGEELEIMTLASGQRVAEILQSYCGEVGINVKLNVLDWALLSQLRLDGSAWDLFAWSINTSSLAYNWSIRYDANAYSTGDATSRHDYVLTEMLYETWTNSGYTEENIDKVHYYLMDNAYAMGLIEIYYFTFIRKDAGLTNVVTTYFGHVAPWASTFTKIS